MTHKFRKARSNTGIGSVSPVPCPLSPVPSFGRRRFLRLSGLTLLGLGVAPLVAACGFQEVQNQSIVEIRDLSGFDVPSQRGFSPATLTVPKGSQVTWVNKGTLPHSVTDDPSLAKKPSDAVRPSGAQPFDSGTLYAGETWSHTFGVPGKYVYFSTYDEADNMIGTIIVAG